jgi:dipeptidyl aminopeptidase/acylaminoacyl peptidase
MRHVAIILLVCLCTVTVFAQGKRPFTFEDMMKLKRVGDPEVSPDGKWVLFAAADVDLAANTRTPHVWVVPLGAAQEGKAGSSTPPKDSLTNPSAPVGMTNSGEREIISDQDADRPRWAPDGKRFAFISTKQGSSQVWVADFDGAVGTVTSVWKLTSIPTEARGELWSPDGKNILFVSNVYPECDGAPAEEQTCNAKKLEAAEKSPVKALIFTHLLYRHWNAYKEGKRSHLFVVAAPVAPSFRQDSAGRRYENLGFAPLPAIPHDLTPGDFDAPPFSLGGQDNYAFSPDGQEICYSSNHDKVEATSTNNDLWIVPVSGGPAKNITADNPASDSTPVYSPDGKYIAYRAQQRPGYESDRWRLMLYDRKTGKRTDLTLDVFDRWVGTFTWAQDSSRLYFVAEDKGESPIYSVDFTSKINSEPGYDIVLHSTDVHINTLVEGFNDDLTAAADGKLFYTSMSMQAPNEIWGLSRVPCSNAPAEDPSAGVKAYKHLLCLVNRITHLNDAILSQISMSPLESFWFTGAHDDKVQGFLVKPPNFDASKKYPVKFLIHGGPQQAWDDDWSYRWNPELLAANGYVVIMINFHGSPGYGQKFIDSINGDWGGAPFEDLMKGLDYAEQTYPFIDKDRECALGASFGGYMINWVLGHTNRFKCLVSHDGTFNNESDWGATEELWFPEWEFHGTPYTNRELYRKWSPHLFAANFKTPTLVIHGQLDYRLDVSEGFQLFTTLQRLGVPSKMLYFPDEGHWVLKPQNSQLWYKTVNDWVDQWVGQ